MTDKFKGSINELKARVEAAGITGEWSDEGQGKHAFRTSYGALVNFWPRTGTIQFQGKESARAKMHAALLGVSTEPVVRATLRLPQSLWAAVQHKAIDERVPAAELVARALKEFLKKGGHK